MTILRLRALWTSALLLACSRPREQAPTGLVDSAGILIASGPRVDRPTPWRVTFLHRLAPDDADSPLHLVRSPAFVGLDSAGRIFVLNELTGRIEVYDPDGRLLGTRGRKGGGPGEYQYVGTLDVRPDGTLFVVDHGKDAIVGFGPDGAVLLERSLAALGYAYGGASFLGDTGVFHGHELDDEKNPVHALRWIAPERDTTLATLRPATLGQATFQCPGSTITLTGAELLLTPNLAWAVAPGLVAVAAGDEYQVAVFIGGRLHHLSRRPIVPIPATVEHVRRRYPDGIALFQGRSCRQGPDVLAAALGIAPTLPVLDRLRYAPDGALWVQRFTLPGAAPITDVFGPDGTYLGSQTGPGFPVGFASEGRFLGLVPDVETGGYQLHLYRLSPAPW
ncbi:MAG: 6-bladed beta-propeller [Gemmatimonadales bacterium]